MARGWESKAVESQIDSATMDAGRSQARHRTTGEIEHDAKLQGLMLSRTRVLHDLQAACNPRYRGQLEQALAFLDRQIADLGGHE